jgi:hypothetical protein
LDYDKLIEYLSTLPEDLTSEEFKIKIKSDAEKDKDHIVNDLFKHLFK